LRLKRAYATDERLAGEADVHIPRLRRAAAGLKEK
jgi:hypothetical protein